MLENVSSQGAVSPSYGKISTGVSTPTPAIKPTPQPVKSEFKQDSLEVKEVSAESIKEIVDGLNHFLTPTHSSLKFEFHEQLNEYYVTLIDDSTKEVIKEIPSKKMLDFYAATIEKLGFLMDKKI